jgi:hypothetical protein
VDRRSFYLPPADLEWPLTGVPEQLESENEEVYWDANCITRHRSHFVKEELEKLNCEYISDFQGGFTSIKKHLHSTKA